MSSARWALGLRPPPLAEDKDDDLAPSQEATAKLPQPEGTFESQLTLAELGLNLDDTGAAMEADYEMGALTMQSLGLNLYDLEEPHVVDAPEDIAERLGRIMNTFGNVGASADFVLVSNAMEPDSSIRQPSFALGSAPRVQYTTAAGAPDTMSDDDDGGEQGDTEELEVEDEREVPGYSLRPPPRESGLEARRAQRTPRQQVEDRVPPTARGVMSSDSKLQKKDINLGDLGLDLRDLSEGIARDSPRLRPRDTGLEAQREQRTTSQQVEGRVHPANRGMMSSAQQKDDINLGDLELDLRDLSEGVVRDSPRSDGLKLDDLGLELEDVAVGVDNIDDSVLALAQQLVKENVN